MDELMDLDLDPPEMAGTGSRVFAASHACVCNPLHKAHYPKDWYVSLPHRGDMLKLTVKRIPSNCAFTSQHNTPEEAQITGAPATTGLGVPNGGLQVVKPSRAIYDKIIDRLSTSSATSKYDFADQSLLSDVFYGQWVALPYIYNALKTMRWKGVHDAIWRDDKVKNVHYILSPKPWDEDEEARKLKTDPLNVWWWEVTEERKKEEKSKGIDDQF